MVSSCSMQRFVAAIAVLLLAVLVLPSEVDAVHDGNAGWSSIRIAGGAFHRHFLRPSKAKTRRGSKPAIAKPKVPPTRIYIDLINFKDVSISPALLLAAAVCSIEPAGG